MLRTVSKSNHFEDEARKLVNEQLIASGQRKNLSLRRRSKLTSTDTDAIAAALNKYVATNPSLPEGMVTALVGLLESTTSDSRELTKQMNALLISNAQCGSPYIVAALAKRAQPDVLGSVLSDAVRAKDTGLVASLLDVGADPKFLNNLEIIQLVKLDAWTFGKMQSIHPISEEKVQSLCIYAIEQNDVDALAALVNGRMDLADGVGQHFTPADRDVLLLLVVKSEVQNILPMLEKLASRTAHWPLQDASVLRIALENTQADYYLQTSVFQCLFTRFQMPESFSNALDFEYVFHQCLRNGRYDLISMMRSSNLKVPANIVAFICENDLLEVLDELLKGEVEIPHNIWSYTPSLMRNGSAAMVGSLLNYMFQHYVEVPDKEQLFMQCISSGQTQLITRLIDMGVDVNFNAGEPLRTAILAGNVDLVRLMLQGQLSVNTIEYSLLVTSLIQPNLQVQVFELLLETALPRFCIVEYLLLSILCDTSITYHQGTMECLLMYILDRSRSNDVAVRDYLNPRTISACLGARQEILQSVKRKNPTSEDAVQRLDFDLCQLLLPSDDPRDDQNEFCNELPNIDILLEHFSLDVQHIALRLFEKYIRESCECLGTVPWALGIPNLLLGRMSPTAKEHQSIYDCMSIAIDFAQIDLFKKLLNIAEFSIEGYHTLQPVQILSNKEIMHSVIDHLNSLSISTSDYLSVIMPWFVYTCRQRQLTNAISLCTKSRYRLCISPAIEFIKVSIKEDINIPNINRLLRHTIQSQDDLEALWTQAFRTQTVCHLDRVRLIMKAGYRGNKINKVVAREIALNPDTTLLSTILDHWQVPNPTGAVPTFDYYNRRMRPASKPYINEVEDQYYSTLAETLSLAITSQRPECCTILLGKGAPLIHRGNSLVQKAVECGANVPLKDDTILCLLIDSAKKQIDVQAMLDFTLLQAAAYDRLSLVLDLMHDGASPLAYGGECWYSALQKSDEKLLKTLLSVDTARNNLATYFQSFLSGLATRVPDLDEQCAIFLKLHNAGFSKRECFDWAFSVLCDTGLLTPDRAQMLFECGAIADHRRLLQYSLLNGDAGTFHSLVATCEDHEIIQEIFLEVCRKIGLGEGTFFNSNDPATSLSVMEILFQCQIKQEHLNSALKLLVRRATDNRNLLPVLHALLRAGAQFDVSSGETLGRCYTLDDLQLMSQVSKANAPVETRSQALKYLLSEALPIPNLLRSKDKEGYRIGIPHSVLLDIIGYIFNEGVASSKLIHSLFSCIKVDSSLADCESNCADQLETLLSFVINTTEGFDDKVLRMEQISVVLGWTRAVGRHWPCTTASAGNHTCSLSDEAFNRLFLQSAGKGLVILLRKFLELTVDVNTKDESNHSALFLATQANQEDVIDMLIEAGASPDDGSLHVAVSQQNHTAISALLAAGHNSQHRSDLFDDTTPLGMLMQDAHVDEEFTTTFTNIVEFIYNSSGAAVVTRAMTATLQTALLSDQAFELVGVLIAFFGLHEDVAMALRDAEIVVGRVTYSALSLVRHWEDARLEDEQRELLAAQFESFDVKPCLFAADGEQPPNATGIPEHLQRKHAFNTKECAICGDKADSEHQIYARLTLECEGIHSWDDDIICADCLKQYLETRMFPHDDEKIKYKFPSNKVFCWAPKCTNTPIAHHLLRDLVDDGVFMIYDIALFQQECNSGSSMVKCATQDCPGAIWVDDEDRGEIKIFFCPVCNDNTCMECNDLYEKHDNQPCPAGAQARDDARKKAEEEASEELMKNHKKCPKCQLPFEKYFGCDHIICGKNVYDNRVDKGCRYEFCNVCLGAWPNGHTRTCGLRA